MYFIGSPCELQIFYHGISVEDCQNEMSKHREVYDRLSEMFPDFGIYEETEFYKENGLVLQPE